MRGYSAIDDDGYGGFSGDEWGNSRFLLRNANKSFLENILKTTAVKYAIELGLNYSYGHVLRKPS